MEYRALGRSGLNVSVFTLGTMGFGGAGSFASIGSAGVDEARQQVDLCLDHGVNLIDTADMYSRGLSEEIVGEVVKGRRDDVLVATKARFPMGDGPNDAGLSKHHLVRSCEDSLRRLGTDYIDLYQLHERDGVTPVEETLGALDLLVQQGKVRYVGASNFSAWHFMKYLGVSERDHLPRFVSQQIHYSLYTREAEYELVPMSIDEGVGILVWAPIAGGMLTGKYRRDSGPSEETRHKDLTADSEPPVYDKERLYDVVDVIVSVADGASVSPVQVSLAYLLQKPGVTSVIVGARTMEQLADNLAAVELSLSDEDIARLDDVSALPLIYPYWHQARTASDRLSAGDLSLLGPHLDA